MLYGTYLVILSCFVHQSLTSTVLAVCFNQNYPIDPEQKKAKEVIVTSMVQCTTICYYHHYLMAHYDFKSKFINICLSTIFDTFFLFQNKNVLWKVKCLHQSDLSEKNTLLLVFQQTIP